MIEIHGVSKVYIPIRQLCDFFGLDWSAQRQRILRDETLAEDMTSVVITPTLVNNQQYKQSYTVLCLPLEDIPGWLFGVSPSRVRPEFRDKVKQYRRECYRVLWEAFQAEALTVTGSRSTSTIPALEQIRATALAVAQLAEQQMQMEQNFTKRLNKKDG